MSKLTYNKQQGKDQIWETSNRWAKKCLSYIKEYGTVNLTVKRIGSTMQSTDYSFYPSSMVKGN